MPDEVVGLTREAYADGRDPVIDAALAWLAEQRPAAATETDQLVEGDKASATEDTP